MVRYLYHKNTHVSCICQRDLLASRIFFKSLSEFMAEQCRRTIHGAAALPVLILFRVQAGAGFAAFQVQVAALLGFGGHVACGAKAGSGGYFFALGHGNFFQPAVAPHAILRVGHFHHAAPQSVIRNGGHGTGGHRRYLFGGIIRAVVGAPVPQGGVIHQRIPAERLADFTVPASVRQGSLLRGRSSRAASPAGGAARLPSPLLQG